LLQSRGDTFVDGAPEFWLDLLAMFRVFDSLVFVHHWNVIIGSHAERINPFL
jgi:hypothetical protein